MSGTGTGRVAWPPILDAARGIVAEYDTLITLRQLFYRLVSALLLPNTAPYYRRLSAQTAVARREGTFPDLADETREFIGHGGDTSPADALRWTASGYQRDRTEGQDVSIYLAGEKRFMAGQLSAWFGDRGLPTLGLGGYASQTFCDDVARDVAGQGRPAVLIYAGDHDPTGWDIDRDFIERTSCWKATHRVALSPELIARYRLPDAFDNDPLTAAKVRQDPRAKRFAERFGRLTQVEIDALPPEVLRGLYADAIEPYWSAEAFEAVLAREATERARLVELADSWGDAE